MAINIRIGAEFFRTLRENKYTYIDKTAFIEELLTENQAEVTLITRPRRFGKTLSLTTLQEFFDISKQSREIFDGLAISKNKELCDEWMNQYPTVFITLKSIEGKNFIESLNSFKLLVKQILIDNFSLLSTSQKVASEYKEIIKSFRNGNAEIEDYQGILSILCSSLESHYGKPVILLIDEYDVPLARANEKGYYSDMVDFIRALLGNALKTNKSLKFAVLTGCLRIAKESIFTGINNFACYGINDNSFSDSFGFTQQEVDDLLTKADLVSKKDIFKDWYDGYLFGEDQKMYCPWDVLFYLKDLIKSQKAEPKPYWMNTSGNTIIRSFLDRSNINIRKKFEILLGGGCISVRLDELQTYSSLHCSEENLWNILYLTGYLTKAPEGVVEKFGFTDMKRGEVALYLPNREIREVLIRYIDEWIDDSVQYFDTDTFLRAFWSGDEETLTAELSTFLLRTISYFDDNTNFYHGLVVGLLGKGIDTTVLSNREAGYGRFDIQVMDESRNRSAIIEIKQTAKADKSLNQLAASALAQIGEMRYDADIEVATVVHWGIAFRRKRCVARCAEAQEKQNI